VVHGCRQRTCTVCVCVGGGGQSTTGMCGGYFQHRCAKHRLKHSSRGHMQGGLLLLVWHSMLSAPHPPTHAPSPIPALTHQRITHLMLCCAVLSPYPFNTLTSCSSGGCYIVVPPSASMPPPPKNEKAIQPHTLRGGQPHTCRRFRGTKQPPRRSPTTSIITTVSPHTTCTPTSSCCAILSPYSSNTYTSCPNRHPTHSPSHHTPPPPRPPTPQAHPPLPAVPH
jgi:hypothetical protein